MADLDFPECEACDALDAWLCDGCACCQECCNCTETDCDCEACDDRRTLKVCDACFAVYDPEQGDCQECLTK